MCSRFRRRPKQRWMGSPGEREHDDNMDRVARRAVEMIGEGGGGEEMMQPAPSTAKETINGEPQVARAWRFHRPCGGESGRDD